MKFQIRLGGNKVGYTKFLWIGIVLIRILLSILMPIPIRIQILHKVLHMVENLNFFIFTAEPVPVENLDFFIHSRASSSQRYRCHTFKYLDRVLNCLGKKNSLALHLVEFYSEPSKLCRSQIYNTENRFALNLPSVAITLGHIPF